MLFCMDGAITASLCVCVCVSVCVLPLITAIKSIAKHANDCSRLLSTVIIPSQLVGRLLHSGGVAGDLLSIPVCCAILSRKRKKGKQNYEICLAKDGFSKSALLTTVEIKLMM